MRGAVNSLSIDNIGPSLNPWQTFKASSCSATTSRRSSFANVESWTRRKRHISSSWPSADCLKQNSSYNRKVSTFAYPHDYPVHSKVEVGKGDDVKFGANESHEAWKQTLASFKEQAIKMKNISLEAYEICSKSVMVLLKVHSDKARSDLRMALQEIEEDGKEYLSSVAETSPEPVNEILETFSSSTVDLKEFSDIFDFHLGIPYGLILSLGGFLSFMLTGSISAVRFGVILGSLLLGLSISSLRSYRRGESHCLALKGQAAIATIIFLRAIQKLSQADSVWACLATIISGGMVSFYLYRMATHGKKNGQ